jgi:uncharacterized membrane protein YhaH (DUF805 family)
MWMVCGAVWFFAVYPELLCNLRHGEISSEGFNLTVTIAYSVQSVLGAIAYLFLLVFFTMQFRYRRWMANELCHGIDGRATRFKFWIAFVAMVVASCTVYAIFYENGFFETLKISVKPKAQRIDSQIDFGWVKFFVLHVIICAYCTLAVAREYKMRLRDLNLSEKIYRLIFFVHLIPFVNIAAVVIEAVFSAGKRESSPATI